MIFARLSLYALPALYALFVWWFSTGIIIWLDNLPRHTHRWSMAAGTLLLAVSLHRLRAVSGDTSLTAAYAGFTYGLLVWGWQEMSFFMGFVTGPVREPCPADCTGWPCFVRALRACLYHELTSLAFGGLIVALTWHGANQVGTWTYVVLWSMRMSAKLNVLLGVRNLNAEFIPEHLAFIRSFLRERPMNELFPVSVTVSTIAAVLLVQHALAASASPFIATGWSFVSVLMVLAVIEHWFLVVPLPAPALWDWSVSAARSVPGRRKFGFTAPLPQLAPLSGRMHTNAPLGGD
jgi:putative photosynthetic complex assembly protein 2